MDEQHPLDRAASVVGSYAELARRLGVSRGAPHQWLPTEKNPSAKVPLEHCMPIERLTREMGAPVLCEQLRPDQDWAVLRENPRAAVPA